MGAEKQVQVWSKDKLLEYTQSIVSLDIAIRTRYELRGKLLTQIEANEKRIREQPKLESAYRKPYPEGSKVLKVLAILCIAMGILILFAMSIDDHEDAVIGALPLLFVLAPIPLIYILNKAKRITECKRIDEEYEIERQEVNERNNEIKSQKNLLNGELKKKNEEYQEAITALEEDIATLDQRRSELVSWNVFPSIYTNTEAMSWFYEYFASDRVDTVREAINLYAQESQMLRLQEKLDQFTSEMQERAYTQSAVYRQLIASNQAIANATNIQTAIMEDSMKRLNETQKMIQYYQEMNYIDQKYN